MLRLREPVRLNNQRVRTVAQIASRNWLSVIGRCCTVALDRTSEADRRVDVLVGYEVFGGQPFRNLN